MVLGHTRDDQAETVLFRILRGSGLAGLAGIFPVTPEGFIRPLIDVTRAEVEEFLRSRGIAWREDATNQEPTFARNRIRHDLLPRLARDWNPQLGDALAHLADLAQEEERWWGGEVERLASGVLVERDGGIEMKAPAHWTMLPRAVGAPDRPACNFTRERRPESAGLNSQHVEQSDRASCKPMPAGNGRLRLPRVSTVVRSLSIGCGWRVPTLPRKPGSPRVLVSVAWEIPGSVRNYLST